MDFSLSALLNYFLFTGLGIFTALFIFKKTVKTKKPILEKENPTKTTSHKPVIFSYLRKRIIRFIFLILYLALFLIYLNYAKISIHQILFFFYSFLIFACYLKFKKTLGIAFTLLIIGLIAVIIMFNRSMYLLFSEETVGRITVKTIQNNTVTVKIEELKSARVIRTQEEVRLTGSQFGVYAYQMMYKKWLVFIGFEHKFHWAGVVGVKIGDFNRGQAHADMDIRLLDPDNFFKDNAFWTKLEKRELILPGVRTVQRLFVIKTPVEGAVYKLIKHRTGQITLER